MIWIEKGTWSGAPVLIEPKTGCFHTGVCKTGCLRNLATIADDASLDALASSTARPLTGRGQRRERRQRGWRQDREQFQRIAQRLVRKTLPLPPP